MDMFMDMKFLWSTQSYMKMYKVGTISFANKKAKGGQSGVNREL